MVAWLLASLSMAGAVYVNGVPVDPRYLSGLTLEKVNVKVDPQGNLFIDAPGYKVEVPPGMMPSGGTQAPGGYPPPGGIASTNPAFAPVGGGYPAPAPVSGG